MIHMGFRERLVTGAGYGCALLTEDTEMLAALRRAFDADELLACLVPQFLVLAKKYAEQIGIPPAVLGDRLKAAALMYPQG